MTTVRAEPSIIYWLGNNLYLNITNKCPNNCYFCIRNFRKGIGDFNLELKREPSTEEIIANLHKFINKREWNEIVFCGFGEPTERLDCLLMVTRWIRKYYGKPITIRVDTNGQGRLLNKQRNIIKELKSAGVDKVSVSLNAHDEETYNKICRPSFLNAYQSILEFIERSKEEIDTEVTVVEVPEIDIDKVREIAHKIGVRLRIRKYLPCFL